MCPCSSETAGGEGALWFCGIAELVCRLLDAWTTSLCFYASSI